MNVFHMTDFQPDYPGNFGEMLIAFAEKYNKDSKKSYFLFPTKKDWHHQLVKNNGIIIYLNNLHIKINLKNLLLLHRFVILNNINVIQPH